MPSKRLWRINKRDFCLTLLATTSQPWASSDFNSHQRTSVVSVFSDLGPPAPRHVNWENKSTSPFTILPAFGEDSKEVAKQSPVRDRSYWYRSGSDSTRLSTRVCLDSDTSYFQQSDDSVPIESESFYEPVNKNSSCRESQDENPPRSSQSTPVCIARCQSSVAGQSGKSSSNDSDSSKVDGKFTVTQSQRDFENDGSLLEVDESGLNLSPGVKNFVTKTVVQIPLSSTPEQQQQHSDGAEARTKTVEQSSPLAAQKISGIKTASALGRNSLKLSFKAPPSVVFRRNRDIANGVQSPLSPYPAGIKTRRISSLDRLSTGPQTNNREDGDLVQPVNSSCLLNSIESYQQSRVNSECGKSLSGRSSPLRDVDRIGDLPDGIGDVEESRNQTAITLVNEAKESASENDLSMLPEAIHEIRTNSIPVESRCSTQDLPKRDQDLNPFSNIATPTPQQISNEPSNNSSEKKCVSSILVSKPVAKVLPSTIPQGRWQFIEGTKTQTTPLVESSTSHVNFKVKGTKVQPQGQVTKKGADGELSASIKMNGMTKAEEEALPVKKTSNSKNHQLSPKTVKEIEILPSNSTQSSAISVSSAPEKGLIQIVPPTVQESQVHTVEARREPSRISSESTLQVALQNGNPRSPQWEASTLSHTKAPVSRPPQIISKQQESPDKTPVSRDSATVSTLSSRPSALQSVDSDKVPLVGKRNQTTPTSSTGQHFFPKTHQVLQSSSGAASVNHGRGAGEEVGGLEEGTLKANRTPNLTPSSASPMKSVKLKRSTLVTKRPQTARICRTDGRRCQTL